MAGVGSDGPTDVYWVDAYDNHRWWLCRYEGARGGRARLRRWADGGLVRPASGARVLAAPGRFSWLAVRDPPLLDAPSLGSWEQVEAVLRDPGAAPDVALPCCVAELGMTLPLAPDLDAEQWLARTLSRRLVRFLVKRLRRRSEPLESSAAFLARALFDRRFPQPLDDLGMGMADDGDDDCSDSVTYVAARDAPARAFSAFGRRGLAAAVARVESVADSLPVLLALARTLHRASRRMADVSAREAFEEDMRDALLRRVARTSDAELQLSGPLEALWQARETLQLFCRAQVDRRVAAEVLQHAEERRAHARGEGWFGVRLVAVSPAAAISGALRLPVDVCRLVVEFAETALEDELETAEGLDLV